MTLEEDINATNQYYLQKVSLSSIKTDTRANSQVDYRNAARSHYEAYFKQACTTDYNGVYKGRYIDFEAKETRHKTSFPLKNFHAHQINHIRQVLDQGGIAFVILRFSALEEIYLLEGKHLLRFWERMKNGGRKSIKKSEIEELGYLIPLGFQPRIDYIKVIDRLYNLS